jgi:hypothetical protein
VLLNVTTFCDRASTSPSLEWLQSPHPGSSRCALILLLSLCRQNKLTYTSVHFYWSKQWSSWLMYCTTSRKTVGSIFDGVIGIFHLNNPSGRTMALESTQPLIRMSTRNISCWEVVGKGGRCVVPTTLPPLCFYCLELFAPRVPENVRACPGLQRDCLTYFLLPLCICISYIYVMNVLFK